MGLKKQAFLGVKWTTTSSLINVLVQFVQLAILARFLSPEDFGLMAIVMVVIGLSQLFIDMGVSNAIIYKQNISDKELSSLYWLNIIIGFVFFVFLLLTSPLIASFYSNIRLISLINLVSFTFLIKPWGQLMMVILQKEMQFEETSKSEILARLISFSSIVIMSFMDYGVYALAFGSIIYSLLSTLGYIFYGKSVFKPFFYFNFNEIRDFVNFGLFQMGDKFLNYFASQMDTIFIGKLLGVEILGIYNVAKDLTNKPYAVINPIITKVTFPLMSKVSADFTLFKTVFLKTLNYLSFLNAPIYIFMAFFSMELVLFLFGNKWLDSVPIIQILSMTFVIRSIGSLAGIILLSKGKANIAFYWNILIFILYPLYLYIGSSWGVIGVSFGLLLLQISLFYPNWKYVVFKYIPISFIQYFFTFINPVLYSLLAIILSILLTIHVDNDVFKFFLRGFLFFLFYFFILVKFQSGIIKNIYQFLPSVLVKPLQKFLLKYFFIK